MIKDPDGFILLFGIIIWMIPFFNLMSDGPEDEKMVESRKDRELYLTLFACSVLFIAGLCGWSALLYKLGFQDDPLLSWKTAIPLCTIAALSPAYSFIKWYRLQ